MIQEKKYFYDGVPVGIRIHEAIIFATRAHHGQLRKGTDLDYICHPLEVLQILTAMGAEPDTLIAGILHDVVEDTSEKLTKIRELFGESVANLVEGHTEDKADNWEARKSSLIRKLDGGSIELKELVLADKISNLRSIASDIDHNEKVWEKFTVSKEKEQWYYEKMAEKLVELKEMPGAAGFYDEMETLIKQLF